ncbi:MAG: murein biosynthesis integral membrane protein MurJ [Endomicrobium sp.]|jgi:putative peptidoglycan lipid II flippase|nr:murein biosynthesis integral membrane protein MurJ [Endomicrobium sp.]
MRRESFVKNAGRVSFGTMLSRILGYIRDMLTADLFGAGMFADAFYAAFRIPNLFRRIFGEGSFSAAFIPVFSGYLHTESKDEVQKFLNAVFTILVFTLLALSFLGVLFAPFLVKIMVWGFSDSSEKIQLTIELARLLFPFILFVCLAAFLLAVLNTLQSFFIPAAAPAVLNFSEIIYMLAVAPALICQNQIKGLAVSVVAGGALYFLVQYPKLKSLGWRLKFTLDLKHAGINKIVLLMVPSLIGLSVEQINTFVDNICASFLPSGSITALYYSNRLMQLPLAVFGLAFASVSLPLMSKAYAEKDMSDLKKSLSYSVRFTNFAMLPAAAGLMSIGLPIIKILFEHGHFTYAASILTNNALFYYSLGLPAYAGSRIFANAFYSFQDTKTPVKAAVWAMMLHIILCVVLMRPMGAGGLAFATALSSYFNFAVLAVYLKKRVNGIGVKLMCFSFCKSLIASVASAAAAFNICTIEGNLLVSVPSAVVAGIAVFVVSAYILRSEELKTFINICMR